MVKNQFERTLGLLGEDTFNRICDSKICLVGLGGVGGTVFEALIRSGFNDIMIIDYDVVSESNLNRQVLYTLNDLNQNKVEIAKKRALSINIDAKITSINSNINDLDLEIIKNYHPSFIFGAFIIKSCAFLLNGKAMTSRITCVSHKNITTLSKPNAKPA